MWKNFKGKTAESRFSKWRNTKDVCDVQVKRIGEPYTDGYHIVVGFDWNSCYGDI